MWKVGFVVAALWVSSCMRLHVVPSLTRAVSEHTVAAVGSGSRFPLGSCVDRPSPARTIGQRGRRRWIHGMCIQLCRGLARLSPLLDGVRLPESDAGTTRRPLWMQHGINPQLREGLLGPEEMLSSVDAGRSGRTSVGVVDSTSRHRARHPVVLPHNRLSQLIRTVRRTQSLESSPLLAPSQRSAGWRWQILQKPLADTPSSPSRPCSHHHSSTGNANLFSFQPRAS